jgi:hypothetical protein
MRWKNLSAGYARRSWSTYFFDDYGWGCVGAVVALLFCLLWMARESL